MKRDLEARCHRFQFHEMSPKGLSYSSTAVIYTSVFQKLRRLGLSRVESFYIDYRRDTKELI